ncbi:MAG: VWA domain-containing protein [Alphaproteobacteria bacterium]|nr:VWA domain-containing protein [Alphaproteobacteria bacterium]
MFFFLTSRLNQFGASTRGNVAMMFGLMLAPLVAAVGFGVDLSNGAYIRAQLTEAADAAVLAAARARLNDIGLTVAEATAIARKSFDSNMASVAPVPLADFTLNFDVASDTYTVNVSTGVPTYFIKIVGAKAMPISVVTQATVSPPRALEVVMALDNTGSMEGAKLSTLKTASGNLARDLLTDAENVKVGLVPFANYVNVGLSRRGATWLNAPADETTTEYQCRNTYPDRTETNCRTETDTCTRTRDGVTTSYPCERRTCDVNRGEPVERCEWRTTTRQWRGCVGSRDSVRDETDGDYDVSQVPGLLDIRCGEEILPLTDNLAAIEGKISAMSADGYTYIPAGLAWGRRVLSSFAPFDEGLTYADARAQRSMKALILMTDGENTKSANYPLHNSNARASADAKTEALCKKIKDDGIVIYTIAFEVSDASTKNMLEKCASTTENYFDADDPSKLIAAFDGVARSLKDIALSQ